MQKQLVAKKIDNLCHLIIIVAYIEMRVVKILLKPTNFRKRQISDGNFVKAGGKKTPGV